MRALATLLTLLLLSAGCIGGKDQLPPGDAPLEETGAIEPASSGSAPAPSSSSNASAPSSTSASAPPPSNASAAAPSPPAAPAPRIDVSRWDGSITAAGVFANTPAGVGVCCPQAQAAGENVEGTIDVAAGVKAIVIELSWTDTTFDLDLVLDAPDAKDNVPPDPNAPEPASRTGHWWIASDGGPGAPDGHATLTITEAEALALTGTWTWRISPKGPANEVAFTVAASIFHDTLPADGYSAIASPSDNP